ncbi:hypothetical protein [Lactobacillus crispatus]|uniref:hypothetical protein n=1 Tax=Lactobacillus crispatus TaxID=47770 RepID=UPI001E599358|nr:hypothetical protein [Lactobacillus crispatus]
MKTKQFIDRQRVLNLITAAKFVSYVPIEHLTDNQHLSGGAMTDKIRISALNYLIDNIRDEVGLSFGDVADNVLASSLKGESSRFAKEAMIMGWNFAKVMSVMEDKND